MSKFALVPVALFVVQALSLGDGCSLTNTRSVYQQRGRENYYTAYEHCRMIGKQLLTLTTREESIQFGKHLKAIGITSGVWLAATDLGHEGEFVWMTTGASIPMDNFAEFGLPNNKDGREHCMVIVGELNNNFGQWNDMWCDFKEHFFCEDIPIEGDRNRAGSNFVLNAF